MAPKSYLLPGVSSLLVAFLLVSSEVAAREMQDINRGVDAGYGVRMDATTPDCQKYGCCDAVFGPSRPSGSCQRCCSPPAGDCERYGCCDAVFGPSRPSGSCQRCCAPPVHA